MGRVSQDRTCCNAIKQNVTSMCRPLTQSGNVLTVQVYTYPSVIVPTTTAFHGTMSKTISHRKLRRLRRPRSWRSECSEDATTGSEAS